MAAETQETVIIGSFDITVPLPNAAQIVIHGYLYNKDTPEVLNKRLDELQDVAHRQHVRCGIELREAEREQHIDQLKRIQKVYADALEARNKAHKLTTTQKQQIEQGEKTIQAAKEQLDRIEKGIAEAKAKVGMK